jgi:hypothetical protein
MKEVVESLKIGVIDERHGYFFNRHLLVSGPPIAGPRVPVDGARRNFPPILQPNIGVVRTAWINKSEILESMGCEACDFNQMVVISTWVFLKLAGR